MWHKCFLIFFYYDKRVEKEAEVHMKTCGFKTVRTLFLWLQVYWFTNVYASGGWSANLQRTEVKRLIKHVK